MCRLGFIMILGALVLLTNLHRADSFSHHRLNAPVAVNDVNSLEHNDDSNEGTTIQPETSIAQSDENDDHLDSEEIKKVKRDTRFLTAIDHSSEEDTTTETPLDSQSDEHDDDVVLVKVVKRDIQAATVDHSVEDDATTEAADQSAEHDDIESEEKSLKKRSVHQAAKTILRRIDSSEEDTTDNQLLDSRSDEHSDEKRVVKRDVLQAAVDLSSEEDTTESAIVGSQSDERDDVSLEGNRLVKRDIPLVAVKVDHSSEEDTTDATLLDNQTVENVSSEERLVKRDVNLLASTVDHSSEEHTTDSVLDLASLEDSVEDALVRSTLDVKLLPSTALRI
ncbi:hypothetical protein GHT06_012260 [Daphnia sinensis]|uniref:Uncharacterized protein n=1 Tax=Daphnia sinensis TaxID=1820382 RepID=A0AAD5KVD0_9CRUS|nr:hypothetical protein GHT06_012260 [Daphnia sinensis]